ncbi:hypothetical protein ES703_95464 [subsurface metagenome]
MPAIIREDDGFSVGVVQAFFDDYFAGSLEDFSFALLPLSVLSFEVFGYPEGFYVTLCGKQLDGESCVAHSACGVEHRRNSKADMKAVETLSGQARSFNQGTDAGQPAAWDGFQAETRQHPVLAPQVNDICNRPYRSQRGSINHKFPDLAFESRAGGEIVCNCPGELEGDHRAGRILVLVICFESGINNCSSFRQLSAGAMMVGYYNGQAKTFREPGRFHSADSTINGYQQFCSCFSE